MQFSLWAGVQCPNHLRLIWLNLYFISSVDDISRFEEDMQGIETFTEVTTKNAPSSTSDDASTFATFSGLKLSEQLLSLNNNTQEDHDFKIWLERQKMLQENVNMVCKRYGERLKTETRPNFSFMFDQKTNLMFCRNAKVSIQINPIGAGGLNQPKLFSNVHFSTKKGSWKSQIS